MSVAAQVGLFAGGAVQSGVRQALAQRDIAQYGMEQQRRALDRNTRNAWQSVVAGISEVAPTRMSCGVPLSSVREVRPASWPPRQVSVLVWEKR